MPTGLRGPAARSVRAIAEAYAVTEKADRQTAPAPHRVVRRKPIVPNFFAESESRDADLRSGNRRRGYRRRHDGKSIPPRRR